MSFDVFEEEGGAAGFRFGVAVEAGLRGAVGDLGDFEKWVDFFADAAKFAVFVEDFDPVSEVVAGQGLVSDVGSFLTIERWGGRGVRGCSLAGEVIVDGGGDDERQRHRDEEAADHSDGERLEHLRAGA
jgi:hypothetical protein